VLIPEGRLEQLLQSFFFSDLPVFPAKITTFNRKSPVRMSVIETIFRNKIVAIIRGADPVDALKIIAALSESGITLVEVTMNSRGALEVIEQAARNPVGELIIGAGTVLDTAAAQDAISAGAKFIISPHFNQEIIDITKKNGAVSIPGALTPTEIVSAYAAGGDIIKIFPASAGIQYIKDLRGPLPHIPLMPTGGVNIGNIGAFLKAGAVAVGIGSDLVNTKMKVTADYLEALKLKAKDYLRIISES
jgi:2-dehydro-3-deoxyphosphogluconate aldolase/(4S)-4-hydroxy-2-oxoglutarate aldolase